MGVGGAVVVEQCLGFRGQAKWVFNPKVEMTAFEVYGFARDECLGLPWQMHSTRPLLRLYR